MLARFGDAFRYLPVTNANANPYGVEPVDGGLDDFDTAAGPADADQLLCRLFVIGREHRTVQGQHTVKRRVRKRDLLAIGDFESRCQAFGLGTGAGTLNQRRHVVDPDRFAVSSRRRQRHIAGTGCDIEQLVAGTQINRFTQKFAGIHRVPANDRKITGCPGLLLLPLDVIEVRHRGFRSDVVQTTPLTRVAR